MKLLHVRTLSDKENSYIVDADKLAGLLQGHGFLDTGILIRQIPDWLTNVVVEHWPSSKWFEKVEKPKPATDAAPNKIGREQG